MAINYVGKEVLENFTRKLLENDKKIRDDAFDVLNNPEIRNTVKTVVEGAIQDGTISQITGADGKSAYQIAVDNGFDGTESEWLASLEVDLSEFDSLLFDKKVSQYLIAETKEVGRSYYIGSNYINPYDKATQQIWKPIKLIANVSYYLLKINPSNSGFKGSDGTVEAIGQGEGEHNIIFTPKQDGELYICNDITSGNAMVINSIDMSDVKDIVDNYAEGIYKVNFNNKIDNNSFDKLKGKTWCVIGDSLTSKTGGALTQADTKYYDYLKSDDTTIVNLGKSGTGYLQTYNGSENFIDRINAITGSENYDVISVFGGINDSTSFPVGNIGDRENTTMYGAIYNAFNSLITKFPTAFIFAITPTCTSYRYGYPNDIDKIAQAIRDVCLELKIPVADVNRDAMMRPWISSFASKYYADNTHPNNDGHYIISKTVKKVFDYMP